MSSCSKHKFKRDLIKFFICTSVIPLIVPFSNIISMMRDSCSSIWRQVRLTLDTTLIMRSLSGCSSFNNCLYNHAPASECRFSSRTEKLIPAVMFINLFLPSAWKCFRKAKLEYRIAPSVILPIAVISSGSSTLNCLSTHAILSASTLSLVYDS